MIYLISAKTMASYFESVVKLVDTQVSIDISTMTANDAKRFLCFKDESEVTSCLEDSDDIQLYDDAVDYGINDLEYKSIGDLFEEHAFKIGDVILMMTPHWENMDLERLNPDSADEYKFIKIAIN